MTYSDKNVRLSNLLRMLAFTCVAVSCTQGERSAGTFEAENDFPQVYAVNYPLAYIAGRIAGDSIHVAFPGPPEGVIPNRCSFLLHYFGLAPRNGGCQWPSASQTRLTPGVIRPSNWRRFSA
jgi:hypothetical protein